MDYEEKYKQALNRAKEQLEGAKVFDYKEEQTAYDIRTTTYAIFPELKESDDERIRKAITMFFELQDDNTTYSLVPKKDILAWLEKQGEQKSKNESTDTCDSLIIKSKEFPVGEKRDFGYFSESADKVEPKFKVGDWVVTDKGDTIQISAVNHGYYTIDNGMYFRMSYVDKYWRLWTIQDAKKGDVLEFEDHKRVVVGIVSFVNEETGKVDVSCLLEDNEFKLGNFYALDTIKPHPATKEQRDLLFAKMKEAGYEWDADKKELKKIEDWIEIPFGAKDSELQEDIYYIPKGFHAEIDDEKVVIKKGEKPAEWSDDDEYNLQCMIAKVTYDIQKGNVGRNNELMDWLKSLKDRISWKPSEKQMEALWNLNIIGKVDYAGQAEALIELYNDLKKL